jgi:quinohemoprotein amine dehydrogenase
VPATWSTEPFDDKARHDEDLKYAGHMEPHGQFVPSFAGPNPARRNLNNVGNLSVIATVAAGAQQLNAKGQLVVTVQRWNTPSLR